MILGASALGTLVAVPLAVLLARGRRIPVVAGALPGGLVLLAAVLGARTSVHANGLEQVPLPRMGPLMAERLAAYETSLLGLVVAVAIPVFVLLVGAALAALRAPVRRWAPALLGLLLVLTWTAGFFRDVVAVHPGAEAAGVVLAAVLGALACIALLASDEQSNGPEAAGVAGIAYLTVLIGVGVGFRAAESVVLFEGLATAAPRDAPRLFASGQAFLLLLEGRAWSTWAWGAGFALLGLGIAAGPPGPRRIGAALALLVLPLGLAVLPATATHPGWSALQRVRAARLQLADGLELVQVDAAAPLPLQSTIQLAPGSIRVDGIEVDGLSGALAGGPSSDVLVAIDRRVPFERVVATIEAAHAAGFRRFGAWVQRRDGAIGMLPLVVDPAPDPVPALDGHEPYPLRLHRLEDEVHLYVRDQRIELDCLDTCERPDFAISVLEQLAEAEPTEREVLVVVAGELTWEQQVFWLTVQPDAATLLPSRVLGSVAWIPAEAE